MPKFWGYIGPEPRTGAWHWPFRYMAMGDTFKVRAGDRPHEKVRQMAYMRGSCLDRKFSCRKDERGDSVVMLTSLGARHSEEAGGLPRIVKYQQARAKVFEISCFDLDYVPFGMFRDIWYLPKRLGPLGCGDRSAFEVNREMFAMTFDVDGIRIYPLAEGVSPFDWAAAMDLLSD